MNMKQLEEKISNAEVISDIAYMQLDNPQNVATSSVFDDGTYFEYWLLADGSVVATEHFVPEWAK